MTSTQSDPFLLIALSIFGLFAFSVMLFWLAARRHKPGNYIPVVREDTGEFD